LRSAPVQSEHRTLGMHRSMSIGFALQSNSKVSPEPRRSSFMDRRESKASHARRASQAGMRDSKAGKWDPQTGKRSSDVAFSSTSDSMEGDEDGKDGYLLQLPLRKELRTFLDKLVVEFVVIGIVIVYMMLILVDLMLQDVEGLTDTWGEAFKYMDLCFLLIFTCELFIRLYAFGVRFLYSFLNTFDASIVLVSLALQIYWIADPTGLATKLAFLSILRMVRLMRLFVVMNKVQKTRQAYKKSRYLKLGPPVERVIELLKDLQTKAETDGMAADIDWIIQLIAADKLYTVDLRTNAMVDKDMSAWLTSNMGMKKDKDMAALEDNTIDGSTDAGDSVASLSDAPGTAGKESTFVSEGGKRELLLVDELSENPAMGQLLDKLHSWDIDPFEFHSVTNGSGLVVGAFKLFEEYGLIDKFRLSEHRLLVYLRSIQDGYSTTTPYHNCIHALDVLLNTNYFIRQDRIADLITPLDQMACLIASTIHDHKHPGVNNNFLMATKHEHAITYNDQSILESFHIASSWALLLQDDYNFLRGLSREQYLELRDTVIQLVLGTDMKFHFEHITKFKTKTSSDSFKPGCEREDVKFLLSVVVHTADIANPVKPLGLGLRWAELVMEEFFQQGDKEASLGLPISPFYDRAKTSISQCQMGFINVLVKPLYTEFMGFVGSDAEDECMGCLMATIEGWEQSGNDLLVDGRERLSMMPAMPESTRRSSESTDGIDPAPEVPPAQEM